MRTVDTRGGVSSRAMGDVQHPAAETSAHSFEVAESDVCVQMCINAVDSVSDEKLAVIFFHLCPTVFSV